MGSTEIDAFVERVNERTDIYSVVSRYVTLTQKSGRYWGRCPFHNEKTASFTVSPDKGFFYCFGCGAGGNAFKFLSLIENISYFEAIKLQAQRLGIDLPTRRFSPEEERRRREEKSLLKVNELAQEIYHERLTKAAGGAVGRKYLVTRGITQATIETFKLGLASDEWDDLLSKLTRQGFSPQQLEAAGLVAKRKTASGYYDRFRGRVMIPITDIYGHVVGFGGRILHSEDDSTPKYLNSPETAIFNKGRLLFGLDKSNRAINAAGAAIVVEGYMDAISLFSAGVQNVAATLGTAFTVDHAKLIMRYAKKIIFCYDSDEAGQRATIRALPIVQQAGAEVFVVKVPDGKDPDEFIRKHGKAAFDELIKQAQSLIDYRMNYVLARADLSTVDGKIRALQEILPVVAKIEDALTRNEYCKRIAAELTLDENLVDNEWDKFSKTAEQTPPDRPAVVQRQRLSGNDDTVIRRAGEALLRMAWHEDEMLDFVLTALPREMFTPLHQEILGWLENCSAQDIRPDQMNAAKDLSEEANAELSRILINGADNPRDTEIVLFDDAIHIMRRANLKRQYNELLAQAEKYISIDRDAYAKAVRKSLKIKAEIDNLKSN